MGGTAAAVTAVAAAYDRELLAALRAGEVFDKEEPLLTAVWDANPGYVCVLMPAGTYDWCYL